MSPNEHPSGMSYHYGAIDVDVYMEVLETCRPFYSSASSTSKELRSIPPRLDDALQSISMEDMQSLSISSVSVCSEVKPLDDGSIFRP